MVSSEWPLKLGESDEPGGARRKRSPRSLTVGFNRHVPSYRPQTVQPPFKGWRPSPAASQSQLNAADFGAAIVCQGSIGHRYLITAGTSCLYMAKGGDLCLQSLQRCGNGVLATPRFRSQVSPLSQVAAGQATILAPSWGSWLASGCRKRCHRCVIPILLGGVRVRIRIPPRPRVLRCPVAAPSSRGPTNAGRERYLPLRGCWLGRLQASRRGPAIP